MLINDLQHVLASIRHALLQIEFYLFMQFSNHHCNRLTYLTFLIASSTTYKNHSVPFFFFIFASVVFIQTEDKNDQNLHRTAYETPLFFAAFQTVVSLFLYQHLSYQSFILLAYKVPYKLPP